MGKPGALFAAAFAAALVACNALTGIGDLAIDSNLADGSTLEASSASSADGGLDAGADPDSGGLGQVDAAIVDGCSATACELLPDGFQLVALGDGTAGCPTDFTQPFDAVENPSVDPGACTCGCDLTTAPSCAAPAGSTLSLSFGPAGSGTCSATGQTVSTGCQTDGYLGPFLSYDRKYEAPQATLTGGACAPKSARNDAKLKATTVRVCQATVISRCEDKTCVPVLDRFAACVAAAGDLTCPAGWPTRHMVGASATFSCGGGCSCTVEGKCSTTGSLSYFASGDCSGNAGLTYPVGGCTTTPAASATFASHRYDPAPPVNAACKAGGASAPTTPALVKPTTVCCR